ncbi:MAG: hypothetical protein KGL45_10830 [Gammaproteobacteria bacterium]|nr:hypothetical protein [Gammaproteobacteria bacterium]
MKQTRARQILQSLIQGLDPVTGEELPHETVLQHADVLRALLAGLSALEQTAARARRRSQLPDNVGQAWTTEEESRLVAAFKKGDSPVVIAREHGRTLRAIEARLEKLGLITEEERTTRGGFTGVSDPPLRPRAARGGILGRKRHHRRSR